MLRFDIANYASFVRAAQFVTRIPSIDPKGNIPDQQVRVCKELTKILRAIDKAVSENPSDVKALTLVMLQSLGLALFFAVPDKSITPLLTGTMVFQGDDDSVPNRLAALKGAVAKFLDTYTRGIQSRKKVLKPTDGVADAAVLQQLALEAYTQAFRLLASRTTIPGMVADAMVELTRVPEPA